MLNKLYHLPILLWGWLLYLILFPFYLLESGMPQPADWLLAFMITSVAIQGGPIFSLKYSPIRVLKLFVIYVFLINFLWFFFIDQSHEKRFPSYFHSLFYIFNFLLLAFCLNLFFRFRYLFLQVCVYGVGISMILQTVLSFSLGGITSRDSLFFNNPNQLGYYALVAGSIFALLQRYVTVSWFFQVLSYLSFLYLCLLSSSKAAMVGAIILIFLSVSSSGIFNLKYTFVIMVIGIISYIFITRIDKGKQLYDYSFNRFNTIGKSRDDSFEGRGYDRMLNDPEYMLIGAGEGGYYRFETALNTGEIHSSFGTLLFCYGIPGLFLFLRFLREIFKYSSFWDISYFIPILVYSFTHQGLRSTLFWVLLALFFCGAVYKRIQFINLKSKKTYTFLDNEYAK